MKIAQAVFSSFLLDPVMWGADWIWGLPLIVVTVVIHVLGLGVMTQKTRAMSSGTHARRHPIYQFVAVVATTTLVATVLHAFEACLWAIAYMLLGALPDPKSAMLYSLNAITSYGHESFALKHTWALMGALEALNGWLLFGLTTAFLFGIIQRQWSSGTRRRHESSAAPGATSPSAD